MKQSRFTEEQIIGVLKEEEAGVPVQEISRKPGGADPFGRSAAFSVNEPRTHKSGPRYPPPN